MIRFIVFAVAAMALGGCASNGVTSIAGGESKVFKAPPYAVKGKAPYDQNIIDEWVEGGVAAYGWKRPKPRPPEIDAPRRAKRKVVAPPKKRTIVQRIKDRVVHPFTKPVEPVVESPPVPMLAPVAPPPPKPRDPVDELLQPSKDQRRFN